MCFFQPEEEKLRVQLEALQAEMSAPTQFKGRLNELLAKVRLQSQASAMGGLGGGSSSAGEKHALDQYLQQDIKNVLKQQQQGIQALIMLIKEDVGDLNIIAEELEKEASQKRSPY
jgi:nuclear pore complex protein Nup54